MCGGSGNHGARRIPSAARALWHDAFVMAHSRDLIPLAVRIALKNAVGGCGPFTVRQIDDLFNAHEFTDRDASVPNAGGERRTEAESYNARINWASPNQAQRYLDLLADVLDYYPTATDQPGSPGWKLRKALSDGGFVSPDGRLRLIVDPTIVQAAEPDGDDIWQANRLRIFFSHVTDVRAAVTTIAEGLESLQCSCFVAHVQIEPARDWQEVIETALRTCHALVAYVTPGFKESSWTDQEVGWALGRGIPVITVNAGAQPYGFFGSIQALPVASQPTSEAADAVFRAIAISCFRGWSLTGGTVAPLMAETIVRAFCRSGSYASTRRLFEYLALIPVVQWTSQMSEDLAAAAEFNDQISQAVLSQLRMSAPDAIAQLIERVTGAQSP